LREIFYENQPGFLFEALAKVGCPHIDIKECKLGSKYRLQGLEASPHEIGSS
jgi:hypothetical protein